MKVIPYICIEQNDKKIEIMKSLEKLNEMLKGTNFLSNSTSDKEACLELINTGSARLGKYSGRGRFTTALKASVSCLNSLVEYREYNDAPRGGVTGENAELIKLNSKAINEAYAEFKSVRKSKAQKAKAKAKSRNEALKSKAKDLGFKSVAALKRAQQEIQDHNEKMYNEALSERELLFEKEHGRKPNLVNIKDRVMISRLPFEIKNQKENLI